MFKSAIGEVIHLNKKDIKSVVMFKKIENFDNNSCFSRLNVLFYKNYKRCVAV